jgi:hypothetical protein
MRQIGVTIRGNAHKRTRRTYGMEIWISCILLLFSPMCVRVRLRLRPVGSEAQDSSCPQRRLTPIRHGTK